MTKTKYILHIFGEGTKKWRRHSSHDSYCSADTLARYFENLSYKIRIKHGGKIVMEVGE